MLDKEGAQALAQPGNLHCPFHLSRKFVEALTRRIDDKGRYHENTFSMSGGLPWPGPKVQAKNQNDQRCGKQAVIAKRPNDEGLEIQKIQTY